MKSKYTKIFEPIQINQMILKNRVMALSGVSASTVKMFGGIQVAEQVARGGAALINTVMADVDDPKSNFYPGSPYTLRKSERDKIRSWVNRIHQHGARYMIELDHVGEYYRAEEGDFSLGTTTKINEKGIRVKGMDEDDMERIRQAYARTCRDAVELGFDAILFDCSSGWLMSQFISTHYNKRTDDYGGPMEHRARFPLSVLKTCRQVVGKTYPIMLSISVNEYFEEDTTPFEDFKTLIRLMEPYVDAVILGCGNDQTRMQMTKGVSTNLEEFMLIRDYAKAMKEVTRVPVVLTNGVMTPENAEFALENGYADMIGMCRPLLADHEWVNKARDNRSEDIRPCLRCNQCFHISSDCKHTGCSVNPYYTQMEHSYVTPIRTADEPKRVVVVGAGPAGLRAALAADACGHQVILLEKEPEVGGLLTVIAREAYKTEIARYLHYLQRQLAKSNVQLKLGCCADRALVESLHPDKVIIAVGGQEKQIPLPSCDRAYTASQAIRQEDRLGENIIIIGGGTVGVEEALSLALHHGKKVTIVEAGAELALSANLIYRPALLDRIRRSEDITVLLNTTVTDARDGILRVKCGDEESELPFDDVIVSVGIRPGTEESLPFFGITENTVAVGNAYRSGNIIDATYDGFTAGVNV